MNANANVRIALLVTILWLVIVCVILPSFANWRSGQSSCLRLDPTTSEDYQFIYIKGYVRPRFVVPWIIRSTPADYLSVRYTPDLFDPDGVVFIDPKTLAYETHEDLATSTSPTNMSGRLDSPAQILAWMRAQPRARELHDEDAQDIYDAVIAMSHRDLEHFTLPDGMKLAHYKIGVSVLSKKHRPELHLLFLIVPLWLAILAPEKKKQRQPDPMPEPAVMD